MKQLNRDGFYFRSLPVSATVAAHADKVYLNRNDLACFSVLTTILLLAWVCCGRKYVTTSNQPIRAQTPYMENGLWPIKHLLTSCLRLPPPIRAVRTVQQHPPFFTILARKAQFLAVCHSVVAASCVLSTFRGNNRLTLFPPNLELHKTFSTCLRHVLYKGRSWRRPWRLLRTC